MFSARPCLLLRAPAATPPAPGAGWFDPAPPAPTLVASGLEPIWVHLMLAWKGLLLFARRAESGLWGFPCGELRAGESAVDGACRIGTEQLLVDLARSAVRLVHVHRAAGTPGAAVGLFVRASRFRGIPVVVDLRQVDRLTWSPLATVPEPSEIGVTDATAASGGPYVADQAGHVPGSPKPAPHRYQLGGLVPGTAGQW